MKEVTIGVYHQDCWGSQSAEKFPESVATERGPVVVTNLPNGAKKVECTMDVRFPDNRQRDEYLKFTKEHATTKDFNQLYKADSRAIISVAWKGSTSYGSVMNTGCFYTNLITQELGGYEVHTVMAKKPNEIKKALSELSILGEVKVLKAKNEIETDNPYSLTEKQAKALRVARSLGYYTWPRKVGLEEMAQYSGTTRRAFQENLRKAEAKVFPEFLNKEMGF